MLYVFNTCRQFIRTVPQLKYDDVKVEDIDTDMEDHIADVVRYVCMARPINPPKEAQTKPRPWSPLDTDGDSGNGGYEWYRKY